MKINYKHLNYFWHVAKTGSIINASEALHITPQTISGQLSLLEESIGDKLFERQGRRLLLSNKGKAVYKYADRIFSLGEELNDFLRGSDSVSSGELRVGIMMAFPRSLPTRFYARLLTTRPSASPVMKAASNNSSPNWPFANWIW